MMGMCMRGLFFTAPIKDQAAGSLYLFWQSGDSDVAWLDLGSVIDCFATGPQFTLEIKRENKKKNLMLPFVKVYCYEVDIEAGYIKCRLPEGLYELYD